MKNFIKNAFTLSEVLITLVIIGVVVAITVPALLISMENQHYKVAYRKAWSDLARATLSSIAFYEFPFRETKYDRTTTMEEWACLKKNLISIKVCENNNAFDCWVDADKIYNSPASNSYIFIDNSGRAWVLFSHLENIYFVDTNGDKNPNKFGKDRWAFTLADENGNRICSEGVEIDEPLACSNPTLPKKVIPYFKKDYLKKDNSLCNYPPCYYVSWLYK